MSVAATSFSAADRMHAGVDPRAAHSSTQPLSEGESSGGMPKHRVEGLSGLAAQPSGSPSAGLQAQDGSPSERSKAAIRCLRPANKVDHMTRCSVDESRACYARKFFSRRIRDFFFGSSLARDRLLLPFLAGFGSPLPHPSPHLPLALAHRENGVPAVQVHAHLGLVHTQHTVSSMSDSRVVSVESPYSCPHLFSRARGICLLTG